jgi:murein DD-endopeptidase MepM/ murein hydrolase activator NlpD
LPEKSKPRLPARAAAVFFLLLSACSTLDDKLGDRDWYRKTRDVSSKAADTAGDQVTKVAASAGETASKVAAAASERGAKAAARMKQYLAEKDLLQTFSDASDHGESAVLDVLHRVGIPKGPSVASSAPVPGAKGPPVTKAPEPGVPQAMREESASSAPAPGAKGPPVTKAPEPGVPQATREEYTGAYRWPLDAGIVSSEYGSRWGKVHKGIDIAAHTGEPVYAVADGEVVYASDGLSGYGNVVILRHDRLVTTLYAHNSALKVKPGDRVKQGDLISLLGSTGHSTGPHVHFELREGDKAVDPRSLLPKGKFALAGAGGTHARAASVR